MASHLRTTAAAVVLVLLLATGCASPGSPGAAPADPHAGHDRSGMTAVTPIAATFAAGTSVVVSGFAFSPATLRTTLGADVTWSFPDTSSHTATSTQGFFDSESSSDGDTYTRGFDAAGTYPYVCTIHPSMTGRVEVPLNARGAPDTGWRIAWATSHSVESTYDVQVRRPGSTTWVALKTGTTLRNARFNPARAGRYALRARTHTGASRSSWSPTRSLRIS